MTTDVSSPRVGTLYTGSTDPQRQLEKLLKINSVLMQRVERSMEQQANAYSLFQTAIGLETQVRVRTEELNAALNRLERTNDELTAARDTAEQANRFKTRFFTAVGHDVLQPLHAARLSLSALSETNTAIGNRILAKQIDQALTSVEDMLRTILDISRLESGVIQPEIRPLALNDLFASLIPSVQNMALAKNLVLTCRQTNAAVSSDPLMLRRILQNLLANAVHYTQHGEIKLAARRRGDTIRIEVWDTGPGISKAEQALIFEEFERGAASQSNRIGGFGLGLSIAQRMAESLGHSLDVCSKLGKGSRFSVTVPSADSALIIPNLDPQSPTVQPYGFANANVLVIDNDNAVQEAMRTLLERWSCQMTFVSGLHELGALISQPRYRPNIILADYHLDFGECGLAGIARMRAVYGAGLRAIVVTADHTQQTADAVRLADCELLRKPVRPAELRALMQHLLG